MAIQYSDDPNAYLWQHPEGYGGGPNIPPAPAPPTTIEYPKPQTVWNQIYGLDPVQQSRDLLGGLQGQVNPFFGQQAGILGMPYPNMNVGKVQMGPGMDPAPYQIHGTLGGAPGSSTPLGAAGPGGPANQIGYQPLPGQTGYTGGPTPFSPGAGAVSPFYQGAAGLYGNMLNQAGGSLAQQQSILQNMSTPASFISSARPYIQDIMKSMGRSGLQSSSLADRTVANTLGDLWARNQMGLAQGYQGLAGQQQALYGGAAQGMQNLGGAYQNLAGAYGQMGLNQANITGNLINSWQNLLSGVGNLGNYWYHPYDVMMGHLSYGGGVS